MGDSSQQLEIQSSLHDSQAAGWVGKCPFQVVWLVFAPSRQLGSPESNFQWFLLLIYILWRSDSLSIWFQGFPETFELFVS